MTARVPTRTNDDDRYFTDRFQADAGRRLHRDVRADARPPAHRGPDRASTSTTSRTASTTGRSSTPVRWTRSSAIGSAGCRTARCASSSRRCRSPTFQPTGTVNYPDETAVPYTRISEFKYITGQQHDATTIVREFPQATGDPVLPDPAPGERRALRALPGARRRDARRPLRRPAGDVQVLQHGPGRRPGAGHLPQDRRGGERGSVIGPSRPASLGGGRTFSSDHRGPPQGPVGRDRPRRPSRGHRPDRRARRVGRPLPHPLGLAGRAD